VVHRAPATLTRRAASDGEKPRLDSLVLGETVLVTRPGLSDLAATLAHPDRAPLPPALLALAQGDEGGLVCRGPACASAPLPRGATPETDAQAWRDSGYRPVLSGGTVIGVAAI